MKSGDNILFRKIQSKIEEPLKVNINKILIINGARQIGKTFIIRQTGKTLYDNFIEINLLEDYLGNQSFLNVKTITDFYFQVSMIAGNKMKEKNNTLIFLDEI